MFYHPAWDRTVQVEATIKTQRISLVCVHVLLYFATVQLSCMFNVTKLVHDFVSSYSAINKSMYYASTHYTVFIYVFICGLLYIIYYFEFTVY